ncbi:MAG: 50S ribosomal protein L31e [archaeon]
MAENKETKVEEKIELQREYVVPMRRGFLKVPSYRKAKKAVAVLKEFIAKHMKVEDRDVRKVKLDMYLNEEIWHRGIKNPLHKVKVKAKKINGIVYVELAEIPDFVKFKMARAENRASKVTTAGISHDDKNDHTEESEKSKTDEQKTDEAEKGKATQEAGVKENKAKAKAQKQTQQTKHEKNTTPRRTVLQK